MFGRKPKQEEAPRNIAMNPSFQSDDMEEDMQQSFQQIPNPQQQAQSLPVQTPAFPMQKPMQMPAQLPIQQPIQQPIQPVQRAIITKIELTESRTIKFEGEANYLITLGECQVSQ